jgi:hypothetical protein
MLDDPKAKNTFTMSVPSKGKHQKEKLEIIMAFGKAKIILLRKMMLGLVIHIWETSRSLH